eukprot:scaffold6269_cov113-Isochrysis_galbana.AAC.1
MRRRPSARCASASASVWSTSLRPRRAPTAKRSCGASSNASTTCSTSPIKSGVWSRLADDSPGTEIGSAASRQKPGNMAGGWRSWRWAESLAKPGISRVLAFGSRK